MEIYYVGEEAAISDKYKKIRKENFIQWKNIMTEDLDINRRHARRKKFSSL